jgi:hypothetical protein
MREHMLEHMDGHAAEILCRLKDVRSAEEAQDAARAFRSWIASALLATPSDTFKTPGAKRAAANFRCGGPSHCIGAGWPI